MSKLGLSTDLSLLSTQRLEGCNADKRVELQGASTFVMLLVF